MTESPLAPSPRSSRVTVPPAGRYRIDPDRSAVTFRTRHLFGLASVRGRFALRDGFIDVARPLTGCRVEARVAASSFRTGNPARDATVRSARLLDAAAYPTIAFTATGLTQEPGPHEPGPQEPGQWSLAGDLVVRGVSRPVQAAIAAVVADGETLTAEARLTVDRYAFGLTGFRGLAARQLTVDLRLTAVKTPERKDHA